MNDGGGGEWGLNNHNIPVQYSTWYLLVVYHSTPFILAPPV
jgi:hypothetical protein